MGEVGLTMASTPPRFGSVRSAPLVYGGISIATFVLLWFLVTDVTGMVGADVLPSPRGVVLRFGELLIEPYSGAVLFAHVGASLGRWGLGVLAAVVVGVPLGILLGWVPPLRAAVTPVFELLRYIPPFAWIPVAVLWFGASLEAQAAIVFVAAFPVCVINSQLGVSVADPILERAARSLGSGQLRTLVQVVVPDALPMLFTGMRIATSNGWMALVGAELVVGKEGLGFLIAQGQVNNSPSTIVVGMVSIGVVGTLVDLGMQRLQSRLTPWQPAGSGGK